MICSIAELVAAGVGVEADEAVAITQQLIAALRANHEGDEVLPPDGPPSIDNVSLTDEGQVVCRGCHATATVPEVGIFLGSLLPEGSSRVPGGVRYTIARALMTVDAPPFDSLEELSRDLARHERGDRAEAVRRVLSRFPSSPMAVPGRFVDRRRSTASATELRRALREADARLFAQEGRPPRDAVIDVLPPGAAAPRDRTRLAGAVCLAAGLVLIGTGEMMHRGKASVVVTQSAPLVVTQAPAAEAPRIDSTPDPASPDRGIIAVRGTPASRRQASRSETQSVSMKRGTKPEAAAAGQRPGSRSTDRDERKRSGGVLDRLRLGWLRSAFSAH